jgi:hypothetical protein
MKWQSAAISVAGTTMLMFAGAANAATTFELDGNIVSNGGTDWASLFLPGTVATPPAVKATLPAGIQTASFFRDFIPGSTADYSTFTTGSKDIHNISGGGQDSGEWQCTSSNNLSSKGDIVNAYATIEIDGSNVWLVFGSERSSNKGTAKTSFWFLQDPSVSCSSEGGTTTFMGNHVDGDLLIVADFDNGGNVTTIQAFQWVGGSNGYLNPTPVGTGNDCQNGGATANFCATVNRTATLAYPTDVPWYIETKAGSALEPRTFFEGRLNLSAYSLLKCFNRYMANTRQSTSITSTMFDYVIGDFQACGVGLTKACANAAIGSDGQTVSYSWDLTVENTGFAPIYNVGIKDVPNLGTCTIDGSDYSSDFVQVAASLPAGETVTKTVQCSKTGLGQNNTVYVRAKSDSGLGIFDINDSLTASHDGQGSSCSLQVTSTLGLSKSCDKIELVPATDGVRIKVFSDITLTNTGTEALYSVTIGDKDADGNTVTLVQTDSSGAPCTETTCETFGGDIAPSQSFYFSAEYVPESVDGDVTDPCSAYFSNTVSASGTGYITENEVPAVPDTESCKLCDCAAPAP